ncbi:MAG: TlpA family protein disulfide reductase [Proteobacteria bacterium]|nr:TlpA family protein disulfide reductase [Pseudomonadota bacterium]
MKLTRALIVLFCLLSLASTLSATPLEEGNKAPQLMGKKAIGRGVLKLNNLKREIGYQKGEDGKFIEVNGKYVLDIKSNVVVLNFFSTTCIPCIKEIPTYNKIARHFNDKKVKLIYVNVDYDATPEQLKRFIIRRRIALPMMLPNQREAVRKYDVKSLPRMVVIDKKGKIAKIIRGFSEHLEEELSDIITALL